MEVSIVDLASISPYDLNPRLNDAAVDAVAKSLREFWHREPIVLDADGVIVCVHPCWKAAAKLGFRGISSSHERPPRRSHSQTHPEPHLSIPPDPAPPFSTGLNNRIGSS
jgi:hypothetical protein